LLHVNPNFARRVPLALGGALLLAAFVFLAVASVHRPVPPWQFLACLGCAWLGFVLTLRDPGRAVWPLLGIAALARVAGLLAIPVYEDDWARYLWDGYRFLQDGTPYGVAPAEFFADSRLPEAWHGVLDEVNNPHVPTIYGPVLQVVFALAAWVAPASLLALKLLLVVADLAVCAMLWRLGGPSAALRYALCPLVIFEVSFNAHAEIVAVAFTLLAVLMVARNKPFASGIALGVALASKVFALALLPFVVLRSRWRALGGVALVLGLAYVPFLIQGATEREGLQAFAQGWEFNSFVFAVVKVLSGDQTARIVCPLLALAFGAWVLWRWWHHRRAWPPDLGPLYGVMLLLSPVVNAWYLLWLAPWAALYPAPWRFAAMAAVALSYMTAGTLGFDSLSAYNHPVWVRPLEVGLVVLVYLCSFLRTRNS
jgi:alpha-1,6-mannosyltransferase